MWTCPSPGKPTRTTIRIPGQPDRCPIHYIPSLPDGCRSGRRVRRGRRRSGGRRSSRLRHGLLAGRFRRRLFGGLLRRRLGGGFLRRSLLYRLLRRRLRAFLAAFFTGFFVAVFFFRRHLHRPRELSGPPGSHIIVHPNCSGANARMRRLSDNICRWIPRPATGIDTTPTPPISIGHPPRCWSKSRSCCRPDARSISHAGRGAMRFTSASSDGM